jgi:hypothetical protein
VNVVIRIHPFNQTGGQLQRIRVALTCGFRGGGSLNRRYDREVIYAPSEIPDDVCLGPTEIDMPNRVVLPTFPQQGCDCVDAPPGPKCDLAAATFKAVVVP